MLQLYLHAKFLDDSWIFQYIRHLLAISRIISLILDYLSLSMSIKTEVLIHKEIMIHYSGIFA